MRWIARLALGVLFLSLAAWPALGQIVTATPASRFSPAVPLSAANSSRSAEAEQIKGWYRDYLGRDVGADLAAWVELLRGGMSATDVQASILGSDEFFYQKGRDPQAFVRETLQAVTWSEPTPSEIQRWTDRLNQLRGDHFTLAREILLANTQSQSVGSQVPEIVGRLASAARLAVDTIDFEIGGTPQGRQANLQAQSLLTATNQLQRTVSIPSYRADDALLPLSSAERAYQALQTTLSNPPGTAPSAAGIVRRLGTMLTDVRSAIRPVTVPTYPAPPIGPSGGYSTQQLLDQVTAARRATESLIQTLTSQAYQNYSYSVVLRDLDTLASRFTGLDQALRTGTSRERIGWELQSISDIADRIRGQLLAGRPPYSVRLYWQSIESSIAQMRETMGGVSSGSATVLRPTQLHDSLVPLLDLAASQIDMFLAGISPLVFGIADVPSVQRDARSLKNRILTMRQQAGAGEPVGVLRQTLTPMVSDYQNAFDRWNRIVTSYRLINPARLSPVGETLNRVEQLINDAAAAADFGSTGSAPTGSTRLGQNLGLLGSEVNDARRVLTVFAGYREQQSIDLYFEQLSGYVQSINDALSRATTVDARRLAVAMQGVIGRLQAEVDSLNQRAAAGGTREQRDYSVDLRNRVSRIGRLVDEIEAELY